MPVTPLVATYRAIVNYHTDAILHKQQLLCSCTPGAGTSGFDAITFDLTTQDMDGLVQTYAALFKGILYTSDTIDSWELQKFVSGAYVPVYQNSIGVSGTGSLTRTPANRFTVVYRDLNFKHVKIVTIGCDSAAPAHGPATTLSGSFLAYANAFITRTTTHVGNWVTGREGVYLNTVNDYTISLDRETRKRLGFV
jgi:hypothetical protein